MPSKQCHKSTYHGAPKKGGGVSILDSADEGSAEEMVLIGGAPIYVPHACGCDGTEHRYEALCVSPCGKVVLLPE